MACDKRPILYLASPIGFSESQKKFVLPEIIQRLEAHNIQVYEPFSTNAQNGLGPASGNRMWALDIAYADRDAVLQRADAVFAVLNGQPPDEGVAVELGLAIAKGKPTFLFRDDFRKCADSTTFSCNLMLYSGLPMEGWEDYIYSSLDEIGDPKKALARWAKGAAAGRSFEDKPDGNTTESSGGNEGGGTQKQHAARFAFCCLVAVSCVKIYGALLRAPH
jgi:nucleoside 2-deoxyribosyltransferase